MQVSLPSYAEPLFDPYRYKVIYGGRGSGKSYSVAKTLLLKRAQKPGLVLCSREFQNSIADSVHKLLSTQIEVMGLDNFYKIKNNYIEGKNGSTFIFKGVRHNVHSVKSMEDIDDLWLEEAQTVSQASWDILTPTVRKPGSEIWSTFNPENMDDPTYMKFLGPEGPPPETLVIKANYRDNPWFPDVLDVERRHMLRTNPELYQHVWEGEFKTTSEAQIFKDKYIVDNFEAQSHWDGPYFGADWGFSVDPTTLVRFWIDVEANKLYIDYEAGGVGIELPDIPECFDQIPESREHVIRADSARPETISYVRNKGFVIQSCEKWTGCVEDGIQFIKSFDKVVIHTRCSNTHEEFRNYKYKTDRLTGDVTTKIQGGFDHYIDGLRYGLEPFIQKSNIGILGVL